MLAYYLHNLNPIIVQFGFIKLRWYGLAYLTGFVFAYVLIKRLANDGMLRLPKEKVPDLVLNCCIFGVLVGGRLGFCLFYDLPHALWNHTTPLLWSFTDSLPFWGVLRVNEGGMSAHGGIIFTLLTVIYFARRNKASVVNISDAAAMVVPLGLFFGRLANFVNGELYGHATKVAWAVQFPSELVSPTNGVYEIPLEQRWELIKKAAEKVPPYMDYLSLMPPGLEQTGQYQYAMGGILQFAQRHNAEMVQLLHETLIPRHPSQLYEAGLEGLLLFAIVWTIGRLWRKDGMASGAFVFFYPVMRIIGEQFRVGDTPIQLAGVEISKGVLYSLLMLIPAAIYWGYWIRKDRRMPWVRPETETKS